MFCKEKNQSTSHAAVVVVARGGRFITPPYFVTSILNRSCNGIRVIFRLFFRHGTSFYRHIFGPRCHHVPYDICILRSLHVRPSDRPHGHLGPRPHGHPGPRPHGHPGPSTR